MRGQLNATAKSLIFHNHAGLYTNTMPPSHMMI
jgi:hypothetical protein